MHLITAAIGLVLLFGIGIAAVLGVVLLVLRLVREIVKASTSIITAPPPQAPRPPFSWEAEAPAVDASQRR
jgi:hypothetical protein